jgi:hypothetical protein
VSGALGSGSGDGATDAASQATNLSTGARGAGAASASALAKVAGLGTAGKLAAVCLGSGAAATACLVTGLVPAHLPGDGAGARQAATTHPVHERPAQIRPPEVVAGQPSPSENDPPTTPAPTDDGAIGRPEPEPTPPLEPPPIEPSAPPAQQEFGVASSQVRPSQVGGGPTPAPARSPSGGGGSPVQQEFGP